MIPQVLDPPLPWADAGRLVAVGGRELSALTKVGQLAARSGSVAARAAQALETIAAIVPCDALSLSVWDPLASTHRDVAALGLSDEIRAYVGGDRILADRGYQYVRSRRVPHRWCDVPGANDCEFIADVLLPAGFTEGVTGCLFTQDGRYTGVLNLAMRRKEPATPEAMSLIVAIAEALAQLADLTRGVHDAAAALDPDLATALVDLDGRCELLPDRPDCPLLRTGAPVLAEAWRRAPREQGAQAFLWHEDETLWRVLVLRLGPDDRGGRPLLVAAAPTEVPLSLRELEVLTAMAGGWPNPVIAERLFISRHTVARHVEHILEKLGVGSRVEAAARAVRDGLILGRR